MVDQRATTTGSPTTDESSTAVRLDLRFSDPDANRLGYCPSVDWGDGSTEPISCVQSCTVPPLSPGPGSAGVARYEHTYESEGTYVITWTFMPLTCGPAVFDGPASGEATVTVG